MKRLLFTFLTIVSLVIWSAPPAPAALTFAVDNDRIEYPANNFNIHDGTNSAGTVLIWVYMTDDTARQGVFFHPGVASAGEYGLAWRADLAGDPFQANRARGTLYVEAFADAANFASYGLNKWVFIAFRWDTAAANGDQEVYMGDLATPPTEPSSYVSQTVGSGTVGSGSDVFKVGNTSLTTREFHGRIAMIYVYAEALTSAQITAQWKICHPVRPSPRLFAQIGWGGSTLVPDYSGNVNVGAITGTLAIADHVPCAASWGT